MPTAERARADRALHEREVELAPDQAAESADREGREQHREHGGRRDGEPGTTKIAGRPDLEQCLDVASTAAIDRGGDERDASCRGSRRRA